MKRLLLPLVAAIAVVSACAAEERPEGVVERWLISLNQGAAGHPDRYASQQVSRLVLPDHEEAEPETFDRIEVGTGEPRTLTLFNDKGYAVPFLVESADGVRLRGSAILARSAGGWRVATVSLAAFDLQLPSEGGQRAEGANPISWLAALAVALALILLSVVLMKLAPGPDLRTRREG